MSEDSNANEQHVRDSERTRVLLAALEAEVRELSARQFPWRWLMGFALSLGLALAQSTFSILSQIQANNVDVKVLSQLIEGFKTSHGDKILRVESDNKRLEIRIEKLENKAGR